MFSLYDTETGYFTGQRLRGSADFIAANLPQGCSTIAGEHDHLCRRVDLESGEVVPWQPPAPADDDTRTWSWDEATERWQPVPTAAALAATVRQQRDALLTRCDWVTARATELGEPVPSAWSTYRQALRDVTAQAGFPHDIAWPEPPAA